MSAYLRAREAAIRADFIARLRGYGPTIAWLSAVATGWRAAQSSDLLNAVIRGGVVWLAVLIIWSWVISLWSGMTGALPQPSIAPQHGLEENPAE